MLYKPRDFIINRTITQKEYSNIYIVNDKSVHYEENGDQKIHNSGYC